MAKSTAVKSTASRRARQSNSSSFAIWLITISVLVVAVVVGSIILSNRPSTKPIAAPDVPANWINRTTLGNPDAKVTVQAWEDFLCPHCQRWSTEIEPKLFTDFIKTGKARLEFHQFPLQSHEPGASMAALASECAADQNAFWPYQEKLFSVQDQDQAGYVLEKLTAYATELNLDTSKFSQCMSGLQHQGEVTASVNQAIKLGLDSTPSILVNGKKLDNPYDYAALTTTINQLAK